MRRTTHLAPGGWSQGRKLMLETEYRVTVLEEFVWGAPTYDSLTGRILWKGCDAVKLKVDGVTDPIRMDKSIFEALEREALT